MNFQTNILPKKKSEGTDSIAVINNLESLKILSLSLLKEIEALKANSKSENQVVEELNQGNLDLEKEVEKYEVELIRLALIRTGGRQRRAAKLLNVKISTLHAKIKRFGIATDTLSLLQG